MSVSACGFRGTEVELGIDFNVTPRWVQPPVRCAAAGGGGCCGSVTSVLCSSP